MFILIEVSSHDVGKRLGLTVMPHISSQRSKEETAYSEKADPRLLLLIGRHLRNVFRIRNVFRSEVNSLQLTVGGRASWRR